MTVITLCKNHLFMNVISLSKLIMPSCTNRELQHTGLPLSHGWIQMETTLLFLFALVSVPLVAIPKELVGEVKLSFFFESEDGRLPQGQTCDPWPYTSCDIYLTICVTSQGDGSCNIYFHRTGLWKDANVGQAAVAFPLRAPASESLDVSVEVWDEDTSDRPDPIAKFRGNLIVAEMQNTPSAFRMVREDANFVNKVRFESYGHIICARFHYGGDCSRKCIPDPERYVCDVNGYKKCRRGFLGVECDQRDYCLNHTCAEFAECKNTLSGFECWCFQSKGPECHFGYDPCAPELKTCSGHGSCTPDGRYNLSFKCNCDVDWEGQRCNQRRPSCLVALETNQTLCQSGGRCRDLLGNVGAYICVCPSGWWGKHCEKRTAVVYKLALLITVIVGICLVILTLVGFVFDVCCKNCLHHRKPSFAYMSSAQLSKQRLNCPSSGSGTGDCAASLFGV
ncbi:protein jagged 2 [Echinococcus multilocularis]|uniref:Protein jagged 2 n=1 Tax=Echinococcus multilocularis TaxID=6211 RepID=A0A068XWK4_ECHMU|nr:protein jagged 2 [Echinococcus multilocularis]